MASAQSTTPHSQHSSPSKVFISGAALKRWNLISKVSTLLSMSSSGCYHWFQRYQKFEVIHHQIQKQLLSYNQHCLNPNPTALIPPWQLNTRNCLSQYQRLVHIFLIVFLALMPCVFAVYFSFYCLAELYM